MISCLLLITVKVAFSYVTADQMAQILTTTDSWDNPQFFYGSATSYCPFSITPHIGSVQRNETNSYLIYMARDLDTTEILFIHYVSFYENNQSIIHTVKIKTLSGIYEKEYEMNALDYEGSWFNQYMYFGKKTLIMGMESKKARYEYEFQSDVFTDKEFQLIMGGSLKYFDSIFNQQFTLSSFPGKIALNIGSGQYDLHKQLQYSDVCTPLTEDNQMLHYKQLTSQVYTLLIPDSEYENYYSFFLWVKITASNAQQQVAYIIRATVNMQPDFINHIGSDSFVYKYYLENNQWFLYIEYYSYIFPYIFGPNIESYQKQEKLIKPIDQSFIEQWHYIQVEYKDYSLSVISENQNTGTRLDFHFDGVYQYSYAIFRFFIGGNQFELSNVNKEIAQFTYYNCYDKNRKIVQCHYSCKTCGGPFSNQCLSCPENSNRVYDAVLQTCNCQLWFLDKQIAKCYGSSDENSQEKEIYLPLDPRYDQLEPEVICAYGYFKYDNECYQCPAAAQDGMVFCMECLNNPETFFNEPFCLSYWQPYDNNKQNVYYKQHIQIDQNVELFVLVDEEVIPCMNCIICDPTKDYGCFLYPQKHGNIDLIITCTSSQEVFVDGQCMEQNSGPANLGTYTCGNNCGFCFFKLCRACRDSIKYFMSFDYRCLECTIPHCKYCFQYNRYDRNQVTPSQYMNLDFSTEPEDYITACALCFEGYIYDLNKNECIQQILTYPCLYGFNNDEDEFICIQTALSSFDSGITEISNCQNYISNCINCLQNSLGTIQCLRCEIGYFLEIGSSMCKSCLKKYPVSPELVVDCRQESSDLDNWKFEVQSFFQNFIPKKTPLIISGLYWVKRYGINQCVGNYQILNEFTGFYDVCVPNCGSNCNICEQFDDIMTCKQCNYQFEEYEILSYFDQQCQVCPYPCRLCEPRTLEEIQAINPYFIVNETTISQTHRCILNFDEENSFIETKSGQVRGKNSELKARFLIEYSPKAIINFLSLNTIADYTYLIRRKVAVSVIKTYQGEFDLIKNLKSQVFSLQNVTQIHDGSLNYNTSQAIYNQTKVIIQNKIMGFSNYYILISSPFGVEVSIKNFTIKNLDYIYNIFQISFATNLNFNQIKLINSSFSYLSLINVTKIINKLDIVIDDLRIENCTFQSGAVFWIQTDYVVANQLIITNLHIINSTFESTNFIEEFKNLNVTKLIISNILLKNCTFTNSVFLNIPKSIMAELYDIHLNDVTLINSTFILIMNSFIINNFTITSSNLTYSYLILCTDVIYQTQYDFQFQSIEINSLSIYGQTPILIQLNSQTGYTKIIIKNIKLTKIWNDSSGKQRENSIDLYCLFYLVGDSIEINNYYNEKEYGFQDFCLFHFTTLEVMNCRLEAKEQNCQKNNYQFLEVDEFQKVSLYNISIINQSVINYPIMRIVSTGQQINSQIVLIDLLSFNSNCLTKSQSYSISTLLYISTDYYCETVVKNTRFVDNTIQHYLQDFSTISPGLLYIQLYQNSISLTQCVFLNNNIKNTSNSLIFMQSDSIIFSDIVSINSNYNSSITLKENYNTTYKPIGGLAFLITSILIIQNSQFQNSLSHHGGCFYIKLKDVGQVQLYNLTITNSSSWSMQNDYAFGGSIVIDASSSGLSLILNNLNVQNTLSRDLGGFMYLIPSQSKNFISISDITLINSIAQDSSIFLISFPISSKQNQIFLYNITIVINNSALEEMLGLLQFSQIIDSKSIQGMLVIINSDIKIKNFSFTGVSCQSALSLQYRGMLALQSLYFQDVILKGDKVLAISNYLQNNYDDNTNNLILISQLRLQNISSSQNSYTSFVAVQIIQSLKQLAKTINPVKLYFSDIQIINCSCVECNNGLLSFTQVNKVSSIQFYNIFFYNNLCGLYGCLNLQQDEGQQIDKVSIKQSKFIKNYAQTGGALFVKFDNISIINAQFIANQGSTQGGGAYLAISKDLFKQFREIYFINNSAAYGAAIFLESSILNPQFLESILFYENKATNVNNIREQPSQLQLNAFDQNIKSVFYALNNTEAPCYSLYSSNLSYFYLPSGQQIGQYQIYDYHSSIYEVYNINLEFFALNNLGEKLIDIDNGICTLKSYIMNHDIEDNVTVESILFNNKTQSFNLQNVVLTFDPYSLSDIYLQVSVACDFIYNPYYNYQFQVRTFRCKAGEYYSQQSCYPCDDAKGFYSLKPKSLECSKADPKMIKSNTASQIQLYSGYWRPSLNNDDIQICEKNMDACQGGWNVGDLSCAVGYIGALCEECDVYNVMGHGQFYKNTKFQCIECGGIVGKIFTSLFIVILTLLSIILTVNSAYTIYQSFRGLKLRTKHYDILFRKNLDQSAALIKMIVNYFQILVSIKSFQLNSEFQFLDFISFIGNPVGSATYSYDCFLSQQSSIEIIYVNLLQSLIIPMLYYLIYLLIYLALVYFKKVPLASTIYVTALLYLFFYTQPNIIQELSALIANRQISSIYWINKNVSYLYFTQTHTTWIAFGIFPLLIIFGVMIPFLLLYNLFVRRLYFNTDRVRQIWGYIYNDYQKSSYFWEIVRIMQREVIILSLTLNEERIIVKGIIIFLVLLFYYTAVSIQKPYNNGKLNRFEQKCIFVCELMITLSCLKYQIQIEKVNSVDIIVQVFLVLLLILLVFFIFQKVVDVYYSKYSERLDNIRLIILKHFPYIPKYCPFTRKYLKLRKQQKQEVLKRFKLIRNLMKNFKSQNQLRSFQIEDISQFRQVSTIIHNFDGKRLITEES